MDIQKKQVSVNMPVADFNASAIVDSDAIVSDSKPDLLKILHIDASVKVSRAEVLSGKMMIGGHVTYKVLYQPENADGICCINTGADFSHMEENPDFSEGMYCNVNAEVEHLEPELINSRKLKIKSVVGMEICVESDMPVMLPLEISGDNLQTKHCHFGGYSRQLTMRDIITVSDSLSLPSGTPNIGSLLRSDVSLCNKDVKVIAGKIIIKGDLKVCNMYTPEDSANVHCCRHSMPFTEILDAEGISEEHLCHVKTEIEESDFSLATDSDGDVRIINANVRIGVKICADMPISENVITDVYSLTDNLDIKYSTLNMKNPVFTSEFDHTLNCSVRPDVGMTVQSVYNMTAKPVVTGVTAHAGKSEIDGYLDIICLCIINDKACPIAVHTEEIPFKIEAAAEMCTPDMVPTAELETNLVNFDLGISGGIDVRIVMSCRLQLSECGKVTMVESIESGGIADSKSPSIVLYFVQKDDTLWDIAKRYHTKTEYIEELNGDNCKNLKAGNQLLIPRG